MAMELRIVPALPPINIEEPTYWNDPALTAAPGMLQAWETCPVEDVGALEVNDEHPWPLSYDWCSSTDAVPYPSDPLVANPGHAGTSGTVTWSFATTPISVCHVAVMIDIGQEGSPDTDVIVFTDNWSLFGF